jgi:ribosomal protein S18 acetylase RimI-like enzyme
MREKILPGYVAFTGGKYPAGYIFFLVNRAKGSIGALYMSPTAHPDKAQEIADNLVEFSIVCLQDSGDIHRIEAQIFPFHGQNYERIFGKYGFYHYPRLYLVRNLDADFTANWGDHPRSPVNIPASNLKIISWDSAIIGRAAATTAACYKEQPDYEVFEDYHTQSNCENYLHGLLTNPGCGVFMPDASYMCLDENGKPRGFIICSRISDGRALIPQIVTHPAWQGRGLGAALMSRCMRQLQAMNFHSLSLVVTVENSRACEWYRRIGFQPRREFGAFIWNRGNPS